jgi:hypothetical protein
MLFIESARAFLAAINPALPAIALVLVLWAPQAAIRRWLPALWELPASWGPKGHEARRLWQALPSLVGGAALGALSAGGDPWEAGTGALIGAVTPFWHHLLAAIPFVPYTGELGSKRDKDDDDKTPPTGTKAIGLVCFASLALVGCGLLGAEHAEAPPCDEVSYAQLSVSCGNDETECDRQLSERETFCAERIEESK